MTFHGTQHDAEQYRVELAADYAARRSLARAAPLLTVGELLGRWLAADHPWKPSTRVGYASNARYLCRDPLATVRVVSLTPRQVRASMDRWERAGASISVVADRYRVLRSAAGWAYDERIIDSHPLRLMRGPGRAEPRRPISERDLAALLGAAETSVLETVANDDGPNARAKRRHVAEQGLLLVRLAADTGARRGELAALQLDDLAGRVLHIQRAVSAGQLTTPKSGRGRLLTLGGSTARLWHTVTDEWRTR